MSTPVAVVNEGRAKDASGLPIIPAEEWHESLSHQARSGKCGLLLNHAVAPEVYDNGFTRYTARSLLNGTTIDVAITGSGMMGNPRTGILAAASHSEFPYRLVGALPSRDVASLSDERVAQLGRDGIPKEIIAHDMDALIARGPHVIIIASPNEAHFDQVMKAVNAGIHVYCEKPVVLARDQAEAIRDVAISTETFVGCNSFYKHYELVRLLAEVVQRQTIGGTYLGPLQGIHVAYEQSWVGLARLNGGTGGWREAAPHSAARDLGPHAYEMLTTIMQTGIDYGSMRVKSCNYAPSECFLLKDKEIKDFRARTGCDVEKLRGLEYDSKVFVRADGTLNNNIPFTLKLSQVTPLATNHHRVLVRFERAFLEFDIENPDILTLETRKRGRFFGEHYEPKQRIEFHRGDAIISGDVNAAFRGHYPGGHIQGHMEAQCFGLTHGLLDGVIRSEMRRGGREPIGIPVSGIPFGWVGQVGFVEALSK